MLTNQYPGDQDTRDRRQVRDVLHDVNVSKYFQGEPGHQGIPGPRGPSGLGLQGDKVSMSAKWLIT